MSRNRCYLVVLPEDAPTARAYELRPGGPTEAEQLRRLVPGAAESLALRGGLLLPEEDRPYDPVFGRGAETLPHWLTRVLTGASRAAARGVL